MLANSSPALIVAQMSGVDSDAVVLIFAAGDDIRPSPFLFLEIETGGVRHEDCGQNHSKETKPGDEVELLLGREIVVKDSGEKSPELTPGSGETVSRCTDGGGKDFGSDQECDRVGSKLIEERGEKVHCLETLDASDARVVLIVERWDDEHDEAHHEADQLHPPSAIQLVVDSEGRSVVSGERNADVDQVPEPALHHVAGLCRLRIDDFDECGLEKLVAVEEDVVAKPSAGGSNQTGPEVLASQLERLNVVTCNVGSALRVVEDFGSERHFVPTVVDEPKGANCRDGEGDTECPLCRDKGVGWVATVVEDEEEDDEDCLVEELTPPLHQKCHRHLPATMEAVFFRRNTAGSSGVLHGRCCCHGVLTTNADSVEE